jgi:hypothetical protein
MVGVIVGAIVGVASCMVGLLYTVKVGGEKAWFRADLCCKDGLTAKADSTSLFAAFCTILTF